MQRRRNAKLKRRIIIVIFFALIVGSIFLIVNKPHHASVPNVNEASSTAAEFSAELSTIQAKAYYVYDIDEHTVLFAKDEHQSLPLASITKLMSGLIVSADLPATTTVTISKADIENDGGNANTLRLGEKWNAQDLLNFTLIMSSNAGIYALSQALNAYLGGDSSTTIDLMNAKAKALGLADTYFANVSGLDINASSSGAYSSAYDISMLLEKILANNPLLIAPTTETAADFISQSNIRHIAINTDTLIDKIPGLIASKTGYTDLAGGNLIVAFDAGIEHPVIVCVLGSTEDGRFSDVDELVHLTLEKLSE